MAEWMSVKCWWIGTDRGMSTYSDKNVAVSLYPSQILRDWPGIEP
jgi:hypothetical protein